MSDHLRQPLDQDFWLRELGFARFTMMKAHIADPARVMDTLNERFQGRARQIAADLAGAAEEDAETVRQHLLLVAECIEDLKTAAIIDVARTLLAGDVVEACREGRSRWARLPLALLAYVEDPRALLSVAMCDRWHALGRCVMRVAGRVPAGTPLTEASVKLAAEAGLMAWRGNRLVPPRGPGVGLGTGQVPPIQVVRPGQGYALRDVILNRRRGGGG